MTQTNVGDWEEVADSNFWNPQKEGEAVEGVIVSKENDKFGLKVIIENAGKRTTLPSHVVLQNRLASCKEGDLIKVEFVRKELPSIKGHSPTNIYKVYTKKL